MSNTANRLRTPTVGAPVKTKDNEHVGTVKEIHGGYFKINVTMGRDFWLKRDFIADETPSLVTLTIDKKEIDEHRLAEPGLEHPTDPEILNSAEVLREHDALKEVGPLNEARSRAGLFETLH